MDTPKKKHNFAMRHFHLWVKLLLFGFDNFFGSKKNRKQGDDHGQS